MRPRLLLLLCAVAAGCGGTTYSVGGYSVSVQSNSYTFDAANGYCGALGSGQIEVRLTGYGPACTAAPAGARSELQLILGVGSHPNNHAPYSVSQVDCVNGPGDAAVAYMSHYPAGAAAPDAKVAATGGSILLLQYDPNGVMPTIGTFSLVFGSQQLSGKFDATHCS